MAIKYPIYEMRDGRTRLGEDYFAPMLKDLDSRLDKLESAKISWDEAVRALQEFGLERIDNSIIPVLQAAQAALAEAQAMVLDLQQQIEDADVQGQLDTALDAQADTFNTALTALADEVVANDTAQTEALEAVDSAIQDQLTDLQALIYSAL